MRHVQAALFCFGWNPTWRSHNEQLRNGYKGKVLDSGRVIQWFKGWENVLFELWNVRVKLVSVLWSCRSLTCARVVLIALLLKGNFHSLVFAKLVRYRNFFPVFIGLCTLCTSRLYSATTRCWALGNKRTLLLTLHTFPLSYGSKISGIQTTSRSVGRSTDPAGTLCERRYFPLFSSSPGTWSPFRSC